MKVADLAKELKVSTDDILKTLKSLKLKAKDSDQDISEFVVTVVRSTLKKPGSEPAANVTKAEEPAKPKKATKKTEEKPVKVEKEEKREEKKDEKREKPKKFEKEPPKESKDIKKKPVIKKKISKEPLIT